MPIRNFTIIVCRTEENAKRRDEDPEAPCFPESARSQAKRIIEQEEKLLAQPEETPACTEEADWGVDGNEKEEKEDEGKEDEGGEDEGKEDEGKEDEGGEDEGKEDEGKEDEENEGEENEDEGKEEDGKEEVQEEDVRERSKKRAPIHYAYSGEEWSQPFHGEQGSWHNTTQAGVKIRKLNPECVAKVLWENLKMDENGKWVCDAKSLADAENLGYRLLEQDGTDTHLWDRVLHYTSKYTVYYSSLFQPVY